MKESKRIFRIWDFRVSHDQLLIRSPKSASEPSNIDLAFVGVEFVELPTMLKGLRVAEPTADDAKRVELALNRPVALNRVFVIETDGHRYAIVAAAMRVSENELDMFESSLERF